MKLALGTVNSLQLRINHCGYARLDARWKLTNVAVPYSKLYYIRSGSGFLEVDGERIPLEPGYVYLTPFGTCVSCGCTELEKLFFHICLNCLESEDLLGQLRGVRRLPFSAEEFDKLAAWYRAKDYTGLLRLKQQLLQTALAFLEEDATENFPVRCYSEVVGKALIYIRQNVRANLTAAQIADSLFVSESKLRKAFRAEVGQNLGSFIDETVLMKAAHLLTEERLSVQEVSARLGFCDQFYFSRRFKARFQATPTQYRRHNRWLIQEHR